MSRYGDRQIKRLTQCTLIVLITLGISGCGNDDSVSLDRCELSIECPRPFFCNYGQCALLDSIDSDGDGVSQETEAQLGLDPENSDSDGDGQSDFAEIDFDPDTREYAPRDQDGDGIIDALESDTEDSDGDGYSDEVDPCNTDPDCPARGGQENDCSSRLGEVCIAGQGACEFLGVIECASDSRNSVCVGETVTPIQETCDAIDNDCDGAIDEDFGSVGAACTPGVGLCRTAGVIRCVSPTAAECDVQPAEPSSELCDGNDNDCDGRIDEDFELGAPCESGAGLCLRDGIIGCDESQNASRCLPTEIDNAPEICDGEDNDCDGLIDEDFGTIGDPCESGTDSCLVRGVLACNLEGTALVCSVEASESSSEVCNDIDDDCDGQIDESFSQKGDACVGGAGECAYAGVLVCDDTGSALICDTAMPTTNIERCDTLDNDCDGLIDESFPNLGEDCTAGVGACERPGQFICDSISGLARCDARAGFGSIERCNGLDDDCDGTTDETFPGVGDSCEVSEGLCRFTGSKQCDAVGMLTCIPGEPIQGDERCDGIDNDCDAMIDEGLGIGEPCALNTGGCERMGTQACASDGSAYCTAAPLPQVAERCDDLDNDCDGRIDEDFQDLSQPCAVALGVCRGTGLYECASNQTDLVCNAVPSDAPSEERCDGLDNDCDGFSDEAYVNLNNVCFSGEFSCAVEGRFVCDELETQVICDATARVPSQELCNGADDNCNGEIDETFPDKNRPCLTGLGACEVTGRWRCSEDESALVCTPDAEPQPTVDLCDDIDNDCDGSVDEDYGPGCRLLGLGVSAADFHSCIRTPDNLLRCFGDAPPAQPITQAASLDGAGEDHCIITLDGEIRCWGRSASLSQQPAGEFTRVSVGRNADACAIESQSSLVTCWGDTPALGMTPQNPVIDIGVADNWACGIGQDTGSIQCWGDIPDGTVIPNEAGYTRLSMGGNLGCALGALGTIDCWGLDSYDMLSPPDGVYDSISIGANSGCALNSDNVPTCWGLGSPMRPHLGQGIVPNGVRFRTISVGAYHVCGLRVDGTVTCWGAGSPNSPAGPFNAGQASPP